MNYSELLAKLNNNEISIDNNGHKFYDDSVLLHDLNLKDKSFKSRIDKSDNKYAVELLDEIQIDYHLYLNYNYICKLCNKTITWRLDAVNNKVVATETSFENQKETYYSKTECIKKDKYKRKTSSN